MIDESEDLGIIQDITCLVCGKLKKEVYECIRCHKFYCKNCSEQMQKNNQNCINCKNKLSTSINKGMVRLIELNAIKLICQKCNKTFDKPEEYNNHIDSCEPKVYFICKICDSILSTKDSFIDHIKQDHKEQLLKELGKEIKNDKFY